MKLRKGEVIRKLQRKLHITEQTVKTHVSNILAKLEVDDRTQAALYAVKHGEK
ncbi:LuxR C-terminal-related transcriptional regulator [Bacillus cereus]